MLVFFLDDGARIIVRPSGTEPKIKFYYEAQAKPDSIADIANRSVQLNERIEALKKAMQDLIG